MYRTTLEQRFSDDNQSAREVPSFIEPRPPLITNPFIRRNPTVKTNLMDYFDDSGSEGPELVQVFLRVKPCNIPNKLYEISNNQSLITSVDTITAGHGRRTQNNVNKMYKFSHIFGTEATQKVSSLFL